MTREEVEVCDRKYEELVARGELEEVDRFCWEPGDVILYNSEEEMIRAMAEEGDGEFIPVSKMKGKKK